MMFINFPISSYNHGMQILSTSERDVRVAGVHSLNVSINQLTPSHNMSSCFFFF